MPQEGAKEGNYLLLGETPPAFLASLPNNTKLHHHACLTNWPAWPPFPQKLLATINQPWLQSRGSNGETNTTMTEGADQWEGNVSVTQDQPLEKPSNKRRPNFLSSATCWLKTPQVLVPEDAASLLLIPRVFSFCPTSPRADVRPLKTPILPCKDLIPQLFSLPSSLLLVSTHLDGLSHTFKCSGSLDMKFNKLRMTCMIPAVLPSPINSPLLPFLSYCFTYYSVPNKLSVMLQHQTFIILCIR